MSTSPTSKVLYRSERDRVIAGVAGGMGEYFAIDSNWVRIVFVFLALLVHGTGFILYLIAWLVLPAESEVEDSKRERTDDPGTADRIPAFEEGRRAGGIILVVVGLAVLLVNVGLLSAVLLSKLWPLILIFFGWLLLRNTWR